MWNQGPGKRSLPNAQVIRPIAVAAFLVFSSYGIFAQSAAPLPAFVVSTIKLSSPDVRGATFRFIGAHRWTANNPTLRDCIAFAYNLAPELISGGPSWIDSERYDIVAALPGETRPPMEQVLRMFQALLADRFKLKFHHGQQQLAHYDLVVRKSGAKINESAPGQDHANLIIAIGPRTATLPARNATIERFASLLQGAVLDRPVVDKTGLSGRYDFNLEFVVDGTRIPPAGPAPVGADIDNKPDIFTAIQQLGLELEPANGPLDAVVIDSVERPDLD